MVADNREASVPERSALIPNFASNMRLPGARAPIPAICIPTDAKFANPQSMYVAIMMDFVSLKAPDALSEDKLMYPMNSVMINFSPNNEPTRVIS